jgi:hypothetical protein
MTNPAPKKYNQQNYWRYVFAPMFMAVIAFGIYILFTMNDSQAMSLNSVTKQVNSMSNESPLPASSIFKNINANANTNTSPGNSFNAL